MLLALAPLAPLALIALPQQVFLVDAQGGGDFLDLPAAVSAASSGDVLLVREGDYSGFQTSGIALSIQAHPAATSAPRIVGQVVLTQVPLGETYLLDGFDVDVVEAPAVGSAASTVFVSGSAGSIRVQDCSIKAPASESMYFSIHALSVLSCDDVAVTDSTLEGGEAFTYLGYAGGHEGDTGGSALSVRLSDVSVHRTILQGGDGGDLPFGGIGGESGPGQTCFKDDCT